ncbi:MAG: DUF4388 domain-containing protein [Chloroflexi bacterium]|nr:DUF4388 domain-containing protein [Chloroflexota bacterium]
MALKGNLRNFSLVQLLHLIHLARKDGRLVIRGPRETAELYFQGGKLVYAGFSSKPVGLLDILYQQRKLDKARYRLLKRRLGHMDDKALGLMLVNAGYFSPTDILAALKRHYADIIRHLFSWVNGQFEFQKNVPPPRDRIPVRLSLENLIIEGTRQLREWESLQAEIPDLDMALKFVDRPRTDVKQLKLNVEEWRFLSYVNPRNSLRKIARVLNLSDLEVRRIAYALIQAGLVELVRPEDYRPKRVIRHAFANRSKEESIGLVQKLIARIRRS